MTVLLQNHRPDAFDLLRCEHLLAKTKTLLDMLT